MNKDRNALKHNNQCCVPVSQDILKAVNKVSQRVGRHMTWPHTKNQHSHTHWQGKTSSLPNLTPSRMLKSSNYVKMASVKEHYSIYVGRCDCCIMKNLLFCCNPLATNQPVHNLLQLNPTCRAFGQDHYQTGVWLLLHSLKDGTGTP